MEYRTTPDAEAVRQERWSRVEALLEAEDLDGLLAFSGGAIGQRGNVRYLTDFSTPSRWSCALVPKRGQPTLLVTYSVHRYWAEQTSWVQDIHVSEDLLRDVCAWLADRNCGAGRLGVVGAQLVPGDALSALREALPSADLCDVGEAFGRLRGCKTPLEVDLLRASAAAADRAIRHAISTARVGCTLDDIAASAHYQLRVDGCESAIVLTAVGAGVASPAPSRYSLSAGEVVQLSVEPVGPGGYWTQFVRMFALGPPPGKVQLLHDRLCRAEDVAATHLRPGASASQISAAFEEHLAGAEGLVGRIPPWHGIGLDPGERPLGSGREDTTLQAGMAVVLHPNLYGDELGSFVGDTYVVADDGPVRLVDLPRHLIVV